MTRRRITSVLAALGILVACDSGGASFVPFILFTYSGAASGTLDAKGVPPITEAPAAWATGFRDAGTSTLLLLGNMPRTGGTTDIVAIGFPSATGSYVFDSNCNDGPACAQLLLVLGSNDETGESTFLCFLESGSLVVTSITTERVAGTFSGTGTCEDNTGAAAGAHTVTAGSFHVAISAQPLT